MKCSICGYELQEEDRIAVYGPQKFGGDGVWCEVCLSKHRRPVTATVVMTEYEGKEALGYQDLKAGYVSSFNEWIANHYMHYGRTESEAKEGST